MDPVECEDHPLLPANTPKGQAHILTIWQYGGDTHKSIFHMGHDPHLGDHVATVLHNLEGHPDAVKDFFNPDVKSFKIQRV